MSNDKRRGALRQDTVGTEPSREDPAQDTEVAAEAAPVDRGTHESQPAPADEGEPVGHAVDREPAFRTEAEMREMQASSRTRDLADELRREREYEARDERDNPEEDDRLMALLSQQLQTKLPDPPKKPGWHRLYVSMTNSVTPPEYFLRLGYRPVKPSDWPGYENFADLGTGKYSNAIVVKEMVLFEVPEDTYQRFMRILHHKNPMEEEEMLRANIDDKFQDERAAVREIGAGTARLGSGPRVRTPTFT